MKKIIVPVDGSLASVKAAEQAVIIARKFDSEITFLNIEDIPSYVYDNSAINIKIEYAKMKEVVIKHHEDFLDSFVANLDTSGISVKKIILHGEPYEEILQYAKDENCDLIVMGRRGYSKIKRFFLGSVTQRVLSDAHCSVLVVNE